MPIIGQAQSSGGETGDVIERLVATMARLRDPDRGCSWDMEQSFETIAPYTIEEAYEVADAIARNDLDDLRSELGDLQFQVVFHARMAEERGAFTFADVVRTLVEKLVRRHPHVFGQNAADGAQAAQDGWETIKAGERAARAETGALAGVALGLPALLRAEKLQRRAARAGFDWPDAAGPRAKVAEELDEVDEAVDRQARTDEIGDLLFAVVNWARHLGIDAEAALRGANAKFERRFAAMEAMPGEPFAGLTLAEQEARWAAVKDAERAGDG